MFGILAFRKYSESQDLLRVFLDGKMGSPCPQDGTSQLSRSFDISGIAVAASLSPPRMIRHSPSIHMACRFRYSGPRHHGLDGTHISSRRFRHSSRDCRLTMKLSRTSKVGTQSVCIPPSVTPRQSSIYPKVILTFGEYFPVLWRHIFERPLSPQLLQKREKNLQGIEIRERWSLRYW